LTKAGGVRDNAARETLGNNEKTDFTPPFGGTTNASNSRLRLFGGKDLKTNPHRAFRVGNAPGHAPIMPICKKLLCRHMKAA
jgi:hypothetical protein